MRKQNVVAAISTLNFAALLLIASLVFAGALEAATYQIGSTGNVVAVGVGVYWNPSCTEQVTKIDWGTMQPNSSDTCLIYLRNEGNQNITLTLWTSDWGPVNASNYLHLNWNRESTMMLPTSIINGTLTLSVDANVWQGKITAFSFTIFIQGTVS